MHDSGARIVANPAGPLFSTPGFEDDCIVTVCAGDSLPAGQGGPNDRTLEG